jgi:alkaline phosphatase D
MNGADATGDPRQRDKVRLSTAFQEAFRETLAQRLAPGSFPSAYSDPRFWHAPSQPLGTPSIRLDDELWLHLCDVRTWRTRTFMTSEAKRTLLGDAQRAQVGAAIEAAPDAVHLIASGSTMADWKPYARDLKWLLGLAAGQRAMVLSGDIHRNEVDMFLTDGFPLHEATSSGAAVRDGVVVGKKQENFGVLDVDENAVRLYLVHNGKLQNSLSRTYDRVTWQRV